VQLQGLWHRYDGTAETAWTLQGIDLTLRQGELVGLLGPSGCGKTTLLRLIAGFERPERGTVCIDGRTVAGPGRWLAPERRGVGMVFQEGALFPHLSVARNVAFGVRERAGREERVRSALALVATSLVVGLSRSLRREF
jgi:iron(III) transport system ATP-binding protein